MTTLIDWARFGKELRLKYGISIDDEVFMSPHVALAIQDCSDINQSGNRWAKLDIIPTNMSQIVRLYIGVIHTNGMHEREQVTRTYFMDSDNKPKFINHVNL